MDDIYIIELVKKKSEQLINEFYDTLILEGKININKNADILKIEEMELIEDTLPYLENIYRNPNRLIINEDEIVKIELAKKITVASVKHLAKHTNFIKSVNESGEVEPSKILNINKEETYETYENKLMYSLIEYIKIFIASKKEFLQKIVIESDYIKDKELEYKSKAISSGKEIRLNVNISTVFSAEGIKAKVEEQNKKIENIEKKLGILTEFEAYKIFKNKRTKLIVSPVKKTNMILKNTNFHYVMKLWDYLQENLLMEKKEGETIQEIQKDTLYEKILKELSLLHFIALETIEEENLDIEQELKKKILENTLDYVDLSNNEIQKILIEKRKKEKLKKSDIERNIRTVFDKYFKQYLKDM